MENVNQTFLEILRAALKGEKYEPQAELAQEAWTQIMQLAQIHHVLPMIYEAVYHLPGFDGTPLKAACKRKVMRDVYLQTVKTSEFLVLNQKLRSAGVTPLVVKGIICRNLYPMPDYRQSSDEDVLISEEQFPAAHQTLLDFGMQTPEQEDHFDAVYEIPYGKKGSPLYIELHKHLFPPESEAYGDLNRFFEGVFDRAVTETIVGATVYTMAPTDHLFYLICHAFKHFLHSGFGIRQVCDINLYAQHYGDRIDWAQILENCRAIRADKFAAAMFRMGEKYFDFSPEGACMSESWRTFEVDEGPMLEDLLKSGVYGDADMERKQSSTITLSAVENQKRGKKQRGNLVRTLFPSAGSLEGRYPYLKKHPVLLPAAWVSRLISYGVKNAGTDSAAQSLKIGSERIELMKQYGILDE